MSLKESTTKMANPVKIRDTILRDAHQSLLATRMKIDHMFPIVEMMDKIGYWSAETWGGATFDSCIRFLNEDPWERIRTLKKLMPNTPQQMLLRGQNVVGYRHYADDVVERFIVKAHENGIDVFRVFDALNDLRNMALSFKIVKREGAHLQACFSYTTSPVHTMDTFVEMAKRGQIDPARLVIIGFACTAEEAQACHCNAPYPERLMVGAAGPSGSPNPIVADYDGMSLAERRAFWERQFRKCIKCYGCRNICPVCFCEACSMEEAAWVEPGLLAPPFPVFHLIRAMHMSSRCVACRQCELVCPAYFPLTVLYDLMRRDSEMLTGYIPGADMDARPPLSFTLDEAPLLVGASHLE